MGKRRYAVLDFIFVFVYRFKRDEVLGIGAESAYYWILSFFPMLIFTLTLLRYTPVRDLDLLANFQSFFSQQSYEFVVNIVKELMQKSTSTLTSFTAVATLWSASSGVRALMRGLNKAYDVQRKRPYIRHVILSLLFTIGLGVSIILTIISLVFGEQIGRGILNYFNLNVEFFWGIFRYLVAFVYMVLLFTLMYLFGPYKKIKWRETIPGALFSTLSVVVVSEVLSKYFNYVGSYNIIYETIGGIIFLLFWLFSISTTIIIGGEINAILAHQKSIRKRK